MNIITILILLALLLVGSQAIREEKKERPKTVIEANHYRSTTERLAHYNITGIQTGKPLILLLKKNNQKSNVVN